MPSITLPAMQVGSTLTEPMTTGVPDDVQTLALALDEDNLGPESVGTRNIAFGTASPLLYEYYSSYGGATTVALATETFTGLSHGSFDTTVIQPNLLVTGPAFLVTKLRFRVKDLTVNSTYIANDYYYAQFSFDYSDGGGGTVTTYPLGYSMCVRNSGGTLTADTPISTSSFDARNKIQGIWREAMVVYYIPQGTDYTITDLKWKLALGDDNHVVTIDRYAVDARIFWS